MIIIKRINTDKSCPPFIKGTGYFNTAILLALDGEAKAYPLSILTWHEIVNDDIGGKPIAPYATQPLFLTETTKVKCLILARLAVCAILIL